MAAIARALEISSAKVLILDEPTSSLTVNEVDAALPRHAQAAERRHRHRLHHALPRPGLRGERPGHGPPQRGAGRHVRPGLPATARADQDDARSHARRPRRHGRAQDGDPRADQGRRIPGGEGARPDGLDRARSTCELHEGEVVGLAGLAGIRSDRAGATPVRHRPAGFRLPEHRRRGGAATTRPPHRSSVGSGSRRRTARRRGSSPT